MQVYMVVSFSFHPTHLQVNCGFAILAIRGVFKFKKEQLVRTSAQKRNQKLVV